MLSKLLLIGNDDALVKVMQVKRNCFVRRDVEAWLEILLLIQRLNLED
jgi:hypothetical protein